MASLKARDRRSQEQVQSVHDLHNVSFQQVKNQLEIVVSRLQAIDRYMRYLSVSFQQIKNQQDIIIKPSSN